VGILGRMRTVTTMGDGERSLTGHAGQYTASTISPTTARRLTRIFNHGGTATRRGMLRIPRSLRLHAACRQLTAVFSAVSPCRRGQYFESSRRVAVVNFSSRAVSPWLSLRAITAPVPRRRRRGRASPGSRIPPACGRG
jgi:hypothetical protein